MEKHEFNGPDFHYKVMWRRAVGSGPIWHENITKVPHVDFGDVGSFAAFEVKVQAANEKGDGPEPDPVIVYSGEDGNCLSIDLFYFGGENLTLMFVIKTIFFSST